MRRRLRSNNTNLIKLAMLGIIAMASGFLLTSFLGSKSKTQALSATEFQAGRIIDDSIFYNPNTMTAAEIDAFIDSHSPACDMWGTQKVYGNVTRAEYVKQLRAQGYTKYHDPPFVCVSEYYENPETHKTNFETGSKKEAGMLSAGEIIYRAAHEYNVNPQVLLVMLKKESYVWGDDWPHSFQYNTVMGYACPDGAPCDSKYFGFYNQVMMAAWQLNYYREHIYSYNYRPYTTNQILYNPDRSCGSKSVYLENIATTSLYIYTPYVPNDGALANYPGTSYCGSYGNRNFYMYFREWFGSTLGIKREEISYPDGEYYIVPSNNISNTLRIEDNYDENGENIYVDARTDSAYGHFKFERQNDGSYIITNSGSKKVLDVYRGSTITGTTIGQWERSGSFNQKFKILNNRDGSFSIASAINTEMVLSFKAEGGLELAPYTHDQNQSFRLIHIDPPITDGSYHLLSKINSLKAIDVHGGLVSKNGTNIELYDSHNGENQTFVFIYDPATDYYRITPGYTDKYSLDASGASTKNLTNIQLWSSNSTCAQRWHVDVISNSTIRLLNGCSGLSADIEGGKTSNETNILLYPYSASKNQLWTLEAVDTTKTQEAETSQPQTKEQATTNNKSDIITGTHRIISAAKKTYAIDISGASSAIGANIQLWSLNTTKAQLFKFEYDKSSDTYRISDTYAGRSFDVSGGRSYAGANVIMWSNHSGCNQRWHIVKNDDNTYSFLDGCGGRALDIFSGNYSAGTNIGIWDYHGSENQRWIIE